MGSLPREAPVPLNLFGVDTHSTVKLDWSRTWSILKRASPAMGGSALLPQGRKLWPVKLQTYMPGKLRHLKLWPPGDKKKQKQKNQHIPYTPKFILWLVDAYKCCLHSNPGKWEYIYSTSSKNCMSSYLSKILSILHDRFEWYTDAEWVREQHKDKYPSAKNILANWCPKIVLKKQPWARPSTAAALLDHTFFFEEQKETWAQ